MTNKMLTFTHQPNPKRKLLFKKNMLIPNQKDFFNTDS